MIQEDVLPLLALPDPQEAAKSRLKAFSALASQGAAIIRSRSMPEGEIGASFGEFPGFWRSWSDGAHLHHSGISGLGAVVADESGAAVAAFSVGGVIEASGGEPGRTGAMLTELRALEGALRLAWEAGARKIEARFDCLPLARAAASALMGHPGEADNPESASLLAIMSQFECLALRWVPRGSNRMADALSKRPSGGGLFHGGASQAHMLERAWQDPERGLDNAEGVPEQAKRSRREVAAGVPMGSGVSNDGVAKIALGARWGEGMDEPRWTAAASLADPAARRDAKLEQSGSWALGRSAQPGAAGLSAALSQALAKKGAEVAARSGGSIRKFAVHIPQAVLSQLAAEGALAGFVASSVAMLQSMAPGAEASAQSVESSVALSARQAAHLLNGWELGRAAVMQELSGARSQKRLERSQKHQAARAPSP